MSEHALRRVIGLLDRAGIEHMLTGSFASTFHGDPRTTNDIDIVIECEREVLDRFTRDLDPERFYVSPEAVDEAWRRRGQFNVILLEDGWKIDLILRKDRPFSREEFSRRRRAVIAGTDVAIASAEDMVIAKLEWAKAGESERQIRDVVGILKTHAHELDRGYIERWTHELGLTALWEQVLAIADSP